MICHPVSTHINNRIETRIMEQMNIDPSVREDFLEAIFILARDGRRPPFVREVALALHKPEGEALPVLTILGENNDIIIDGDGGISMTPQGKDLGMRVVKKHETLQCFFSEILGMDGPSASNEACTLEHAVSDDTINRLGTYLKYSPSRLQKGTESVWGTAFPLSALTDFNEGDDVVVQQILGKERANRLLDLGVVPGEHVRIKRKLANNALVVQVKGCDVALSPEVAASICVERAQ
jgi:DtxR family Mn-dependent transcriptional regulator